MNEATIQQLNAINRVFYRITADEFDQTRGTPWPGWETLLDYLPNGDGPLSVLDIGCGNGRFGVFLAERLGREIVYHGVDSNPTLLEHARRSLGDHLDIRASLEERDIVEQPPQAGQYDLVTAFGLLHHVPGYAQRQEFMRWLAGRVAPGGRLTFACWRFYEYERFRDRIAPWPDDLAGLVEKHDYLLDWRRGEVAWRYCHYVDDEEHAGLIAATGLAEIATYSADGFDGAANRYSVLARDP
jgi:tRNA (uracil-5-)-methyltransferase TRM9